MKIEERSYSGHLFRPRPEVMIDPTLKVGLAITPWGPRATAKKVGKIILDHFSSTRADSESTTPFPHLRSLSPLANQLRVAVRLANDAIFHTKNKNEYTTGVEVFALVQNEYEAAWLQIGYPYPFLVRPGYGLQPMGNALDTALDCSTPKKILPPIPNKLLGTYGDLDFSVETFVPTANDRVLVVSRSTTPNDLWQPLDQNFSLEQLTRTLSKTQVDLPFWVGLFSLSNAR